MKRFLFAILLLFTASTLLGAAPPSYDVGPDQVQVFLDSPTGDLMQVATVNLDTAEVVHTTDCGANVTANKIVGNLIVIVTSVKGEDYAYVAKTRHYVTPENIEKHLTGNDFLYKQNYRPGYNGEPETELISYRSQYVETYEPYYTEKALFTETEFIEPPLIKVRC